MTCAGLVSCGPPPSSAPPRDAPDPWIPHSPTVSSLVVQKGNSPCITVQNDGDVASAATTLRYYRSTDATITT